MPANPPETIGGVELVERLRGHALALQVHERYHEDKPSGLTNADAVSYAGLLTEAANALSRIPALPSEGEVERLTQVILNEARDKGADSPVDHGDAEQIARAAITALRASDGEAERRGMERAAAIVEADAADWRTIGTEDAEHIARVLDKNLSDIRTAMEDRP